jgi:hypothetical protein
MNEQQPPKTTPEQQPGAQDYVPPKPPAGYEPHPEAYRRRSVYEEDSRIKSPALATILSLLPGLGQVYVGCYQQGFVNILVVGSLIAIMIQEIEPIMPICGFFIVFFWLFNMIDAGRRASFYNQSLIGLEPTEMPDMPEGTSITGGRGSLIGGLLLILAGVVLIGHTRYGYSLEWLEAWWPMALIVLGGYLIFRNWEERRKSK